MRIWAWLLAVELVLASAALGSLSAQDMPEQIDAAATPAPAEPPPPPAVPLLPPPVIAEEAQPAAAEGAAEAPTEAATPEAESPQPAKPAEAPEAESSAAASAAAATAEPSTQIGVMKSEQPYETANGSFVYRIPLDLPPFHGIEPDLKLVYSSSRRLTAGGNSQGWLGVGWTSRRLRRDRAR